MRLASPRPGTRAEVVAEFVPHAMGDAAASVAASVHGGVPAASR